MRKNRIADIKKIKQENNELISVILICDSPGYRMRSYGPISLISIKNRKLIDIQISEINSTFKNYEIILCVGFDSEKVCKYVKSKYSDLNIRIIENQLFNSSNSCESLRLALNNISNKKILLCAGDLLFSKDALESIDYTKSCALVEQLSSATLEIGLNINRNNDNIEHFSFGANYTWSEIAFFNGKDIIDTLRRIIVGYEAKNRFIFEAINELINCNFSMIGTSNKDSVIKINNIKTYQNFRKQYNESISK
jgi:hypothetical protein